MSLAAHNPDADWAIRSAAVMPMLLLAGVAGVPLIAADQAVRALCALQGIYLIAARIAPAETVADLKRAIGWATAAQRIRPTCEGGKFHSSKVDRSASEVSEKLRESSHPSHTVAP